MAFCIIHAKPSACPVYTYTMFTCCLILLDFFFNEIEAFVSFLLFYFNIEFSPLSPTEHLVLRDSRTIMHAQHVQDLPAYFQSNLLQSKIFSFFLSSSWWILSFVLEHFPIVDASLFPASVSYIYWNPFLHLHVKCILFCSYTTPKRNTKPSIHTSW